MKGAMKGGTNREWDLFLKLSIVGFMVGFVFVMLQIR
jgi:hypothetical protein